MKSYQCIKVTVTITSILSVVDIFRQQWEICNNSSNYSSCRNFIIIHFMIIFSVLNYSVCNFCLLRTQASSMADEDEDQEDFLADLTLHSDDLTPEGLPCTPANAVEVHRDSQPGKETLLGWMRPPPIASIYVWEGMCYLWCSLRQSLVFTVQLTLNSVGLTIEVQLYSCYDLGALCLAKEVVGETDLCFPSPHHSYSVRGRNCDAVWIAMD